MKDTLREQVIALTSWLLIIDNSDDKEAKAREEIRTRIVDDILSLIEEENELPRNLRLSYQIRITDLESQLKIVNDFAELMATLNKEKDV